MAEVDATPLQTGRIFVRTRVSPFAYFLIRPFCRTTVTLDGEDQVLPWGESVFDVAPGAHSVTVAFQRTAMRYGENSVEVDVPPGGFVEVRYWSPLFLPNEFKGLLRVVKSGEDMA